jgi:dephospho-CoA kinase
MIKIGITGSLASGKSTVARLISRNKYPIFNADNAVKTLYKKRIFTKKIQKQFHFKNTRNLKNKIKNLIKKDKKILKKLEMILHPLVRKEMGEFIKKKKNNKITIFEIPLLIESKLTRYFDFVVFVGAKKNIRLRRYVAKGGNKKIFTILEKRQKKPSKKIKISDYVIYNNKSIKSLKKNIKKFLKEILLNVRSNT